MIYDPAILDVLQGIAPQPWQGTVYRHMFGAYPPDRENTRGARWNPPNIAARYLSLGRETALAEAEFLISSQAPRPHATRTLYTVRVSLQRVLDLTGRGLLQRLGVDEAALSGPDYTACQTVGGAVAWLGNDGLLAPSARHAGTNLVIYPTDADPDLEFEVIDKETVTDR